MKTRIKKLIIIAAALLFLGTGVSFAHDGNDRNHRPPGKAYGHYKVQKHHPGWSDEHFKPNRHISKRCVYKEVRGHRYDDHRRRPAPREDVIYKVALKDPKVVFKIIVTDHR
jgi:hypothetical protein